MSATGTNLIHRGEIFLASAHMHNTNESWDWLMEAVLQADVDLEALPATPEARGKVIDLFDDWADRQSDTRIRNQALHQIRLHDAANRDYATMTNDCRTAVRALADWLGRNFEEVWVETVHQARQTVS